MLVKQRILINVLTILLIIGSVVTAHAVQAQDDARNPDVMLAMSHKSLTFNQNVYEIVEDASNMEFHVDSPIGAVWGSFEEFGGAFVMMNNGVEEDSVSIAIKINAESLDTNAAMIRMMLKGESFFDVDNFPAISFVGSIFEWFNNTEAVLKGYMTIRNVTREVAFYVELSQSEEGCGDRITMKASTTIKRSDFGIYSMLPFVSDKVNLYMNIEAQKKATTISMM
jgi:polyisoprenoid-binding protein YceI